MDAKQALQIVSRLMRHIVEPYDPLNEELALAALTALAEDYEKVKAEVERLKGDAILFRDSVRQLTDYAKFEREAKEKAERTLSYQTNELENTKDRVCKLQTELARLKDQYQSLDTDNSELLQNYQREHAELARYKRFDPLIEAVENHAPWRDNPVAWPLNAQKAILRAALKCREEKP